MSIPHGHGGGLEEIPQISVVLSLVASVREIDMKVMNTGFILYSSVFGCDLHDSHYFSISLCNQCWPGVCVPPNSAPQVPPLNNNNKDTV